MHRLLKVVLLLSCGVALCSIGSAAAEKLVPGDRYTNAVSGPITFSDTKLVFLRLRQSLSLTRIAHDAPIRSGKEKYPADIYRVLEPTIITYHNRDSICNLPEPRKRITYVAKWKQDAATWIGLFIGAQPPTDANNDECTGFTYDSASAAHPALQPQAAAPVWKPSTSRWTYALPDPTQPKPRLLVSAPDWPGAHPRMWFWCQASPRSTEIDMEPGTYDPNTAEGEKSVSLLEIQNISGGVRKFSLVAYNTGPDGGSQLYSRDFLSTPFVDAYGQEGGVLRWETEKGVEIGSWPLKGSAAARDLVRKVCHL